MWPFCVYHCSSVKQDTNHKSGNAKLYSQDTDNRLNEHSFEKEKKVTPPQSKINVHNTT